MRTPVCDHGTKIMVLNVKIVKQVAKVFLWDLYRAGKGTKGLCTVIGGGSAAAWRQSHSPVSQRRFVFGWGFGFLGLVWEVHCPELPVFLFTQCLSAP